MVKDYTDFTAFDKKAALGRAEGDAEFLTEVIAVFLEDWQDYHSKLLSAVEIQSAEQLENTAHAVKSASINVGAKRAFEIAKDLEEEARLGNFKVEFTELVKQLGCAVEAFKAECGVTAE